ncbi:MAG: alkaline phosphatase [Bacteroidetes bacterium]|nr:alkaline phosphatase [Bacteroidota bacterium]
MKIIKFILSIFFWINLVSVSAQTNLAQEVPKKLDSQIKNVILMIPDGTSTSVLSLARWYKTYCSKDKTDVRLALDPYLCGMVKTHSSNSPIGDSAPTSSWYATGFPSQTKFVAMSPKLVDETLFRGEEKYNYYPFQPYQPLITVLEAAKLAGKKTGLVFTCEFSNATPADFSAHYYDRENFMVIGKQMVNNNIDVVFGGGVKYFDTLTIGKDSILLPRQYKLYKDSLVGFQKITAKVAPNVWALFGDKDMPYDFDRKPHETPSLAEMTSKAIQILDSTQNNGFFLMVEGSKVDWALHSNDIVGMMSEFLAFDTAVQAAIKFAKKDKETVVIICPDHGNGGPSMGSQNSNKGYDKLSLAQIFEPFAQCGNIKKATPAGIVDSLMSITSLKSVKIQEIISVYFPSIKLSEPELFTILNELQSLAISKKDRRDSLIQTIAKIITSRTFIGFTTAGHTGEDVFLAIYNPDTLVPNPHGLVRSDSINRYICRLIGATNKEGSSSLPDSTKKYFAKFDTSQFPPNSQLVKKISKDSIEVLIEMPKAGTDNPKKEKPKDNHMKMEKVDAKRLGLQVGDIMLKVNKEKTTYLIPAFKNFFYRNNDSIPLNTVTVWVKENKSFYLSESLKAELMKDN